MFRRPLNTPWHRRLGRLLRLTRARQNHRAKPQGRACQAHRQPGHAMFTRSCPIPATLAHTPRSIASGHACLRSIGLAGSLEHRA